MAVIRFERFYEEHGEPAHLVTLHVVNGFLTLVCEVCHVSQTVDDVEAGLPVAASAIGV